MHPRNPYREPPDFSTLSDAYPPLKLFIFVLSDGTSAIDFRNEDAQRCLTKALLSRDFGIILTLPLDRLCPPIPNRLNYILWIQDVISTSAPQAEDPVHGIDIGTGASVIYPLLACKMAPHWRFTATEVDEESTKTAQLNVKNNQMQDKIRIIEATTTAPVLLPLLCDSNATFDFTMCNPPFYGSKDEILRSSDAKEFEPNAVCTGADVEMITPGGESAFVSRMVEESLQCTNRCRWFTSMLGKMSSLSDIVALLRHHSIDNYAITEFVQGQTRRWAIAWSFGDYHLPDSISRISNQSLQAIMPPRNTLHQAFPKTNSVAHLLESLHAVLASVEGVSVRAPTTGDAGSILVTATANTWSRSARRKKAVSPGSTASTSPSTALLDCQIEAKTASAHSAATRLEYNWVRGRERAMFESFCSHVSRKVGSKLGDGG